MLKVENIEVVYNRIILVLKGVSLKVPDGGITGLLGSNGAGKTTTLKAICGLINFEDGEVRKGDILFMEQPIKHIEADAIVRMGISLVPEGRRVFSDLTALENLMVGAHTRTERKAVKHELERIYEYFPVLEKRKSQRSLFLSGGEQQMVVIGRALMSKPKLMMLDEPSLGLAPMITKEIFEILENINHKQKTAILLVEQNARLALKFATYAYIMENGKIVIDGSPDLLTNDQDVKEFYLGIKEDGQKKSYADIKHYKRRKRWLS